MFKKEKIFILVLVTLILLLFLTGCMSGNNKKSGDSIQIAGLKITANAAYFNKEYTTLSSGKKSKIWEGFIVELTLNNIGKEIKYLHFALFSNFYIQDAKEKVYKSLKAHTEWEDRTDYKMLSPLVGIDNLVLEPGETHDLILRFFDIPEDSKSLKLFYKELEGGKRGSIPLKIQEK